MSECECVCKYELAPILRQLWWVPFLNSYNSDSWCAIDLNAFPMASSFLGHADRHWNGPKSPFPARVIKAQSCHNKWYFRAPFYKTLSLLWFSLILLLCSVKILSDFFWTLPCSARGGYKSFPNFFAYIKCLKIMHQAISVLNILRLHLMHTFSKPECSQLSNSSWLGQSLIVITSDWQWPD